MARAAMVVAAVVNRKIFFRHCIGFSLARFLGGGRFTVALPQSNWQT
jgi:hypothetical protein